MPQSLKKPSPLIRAAILCGAAVLMWLSLFWIVAPSERFNSLLVPLWLISFALSKRQIDKRFFIYGAGIGIGVLGFHLMGSAQARLMGARVTWWEPFQKLYFTAGLFVLYHWLCVVLNALIALVPALRSKLKAPGGWWLRLTRAGVSLCFFAPYIYVSFNVHRFKYANSSDPMTRCGLRFEPRNFVTADGARLKGWFIPSTGSKRTIVVVHGVGSNKGDMLDVAPFLHRAGFNLVLFDLRGHGDSSGHTTTFGVDEAQDVEAATQAALRTTQQLGGNSVGVLAYSMGGSAVLHDIGNGGLKLVKAIALDSTFAEFEPLAREQMNFLPEGVARPMLWLLNFYTRLEIGVTLNDIAPRRYIGKVAPRPLLLIHGTADTLIPSAQARMNFAAAQQPKTLYWVDGANHCRGHQVAGLAYEKQLVSFFNRTLR